MKICATCKKSKRESQFSRWKRARKSHLYAACRSCMKQTRDYYRRHRQRILVSAAAYARTDRGKQVRKRARYKFEYGITPEDYERLVLQQNGGCAVCGASSAGERYGVLQVDHDHRTGRVRGLLCTRCNTQLGILESENFPRLCRYLEVHHRMERAA